MSFFISKKAWKFLINVQLTKSDPKRTRKRGKCPPLYQFGLKCQITVGKLQQIVMLILMKNDKLLKFVIFEKGTKFEKIFHLKFDFTE